LDKISKNQKKQNLNFFNATAWAGIKVKIDNFFRFLILLDATAISWHQS